MDLKFEEDLEQAVAMAESVLGKQGRVLPRGRNVMLDAKIYGPNKSIIWWGDIDKVEDGPKISELAAKIGVGLAAISEFSNDTQLYPILSPIQF